MEYLNKIISRRQEGANYSQSFLTYEWHKIKKFWIFGISITISRFVGWRFRVARLEKQERADGSSYVEITIKLLFNT